MGSRSEVEITITNASNLKNVNWRYGPVRPYAVVWVDPKAKCSTRVDDEGDVNPHWDETLVVPFNSPIEDSTLYIDVVHANAEPDTKPLIGSARLRLRDVADEAGHGRRVDRHLEVRRPSGRPHGKLDVKVSVRDPQRGYRAPDPYYAPPYGVQPPRSRDYSVPQPRGYADPYGAPPPRSRDYSDLPPRNYGDPYGGPPPAASAYATPPPSGYPYAAPEPAYAQPSYGGQQPVYEEKKKSKFGGMGTGLAVGAVAGVLGGLALAEGAEYVENKIADDAAEKVEDDLDDDDDGGDYGGDDW